MQYVPLVVLGRGEPALLVERIRAALGSISTPSCVSSSSCSSSSSSSSSSSRVPLLSRPFPLPFPPPARLMCAMFFCLRARLSAALSTRFRMLCGTRSMYSSDKRPSAMPLSSCSKKRSLELATSGSMMSFSLSKCALLISAGRMRMMATAVALIA
jgi:hypothetical protein